MSTFVCYYYEHDLDSRSTNNLLADIKKRLGEISPEDNSLHHNGFYLDTSTDQIVLNHYDHGIRTSLHVTQKQLSINFTPLELPLPYDLTEVIRILQGSMYKADFNHPLPPVDF